MQTFPQCVALFFFSSVLLLLNLFFFFLLFSLFLSSCPETIYLKTLQAINTAIPNYFSAPLALHLSHAQHGPSHF